MGRQLRLRTDSELVTATCQMTFSHQGYATGRFISKPNNVINQVDSLTSDASADDNKEAGWGSGT